MVGEAVAIPAIARDENRARRYRVHPDTCGANSSAQRSVSKISAAFAASYCPDTASCGDQPEIDATFYDCSAGAALHIRERQPHHPHGLDQISFHSDRKVPLRLARVITTGELDRVYVYHCHFGASYPREQVRLDGERKIYERDADSGYRIRFHFCPNCGTTLYWEGDRNPAVCGVAVGAFDTSAFAPPSDSIWEESMHPWLGLPPRMDHHQQSRPRPHNSEEMTGAIQPARCLEFLN